MTEKRNFQNKAKEAINMGKQHLKCEKLLKDTNAEYKRLADALNGLLNGTLTGEEVNAISKDALNRVDALIDEYKEKNA